MQWLCCNKMLTNTFSPRSFEKRGLCNESAVTKTLYFFSCGLRCLRCYVTTTSCWPSSQESTDPLTAATPSPARWPWLHSRSELNRVRLTFPKNNTGAAADSVDLANYHVTGAGGGEAGGERREDGRAAAERAEKTAPRHCDNSPRQRPPQRHRHQRD